MPTFPECPERQRLAEKVSKTVAVVYELKKRQKQTGTKNEGAEIILLEARAAQRIAERSLSDHIKQHGCHKRN